MSGVIIKAGDTRTASRGLYSLDLRDIAGKAEQMLAAARAEAAAILEEARQRGERECERERARGYQEGLAKGTADGRAAGEKAAADAAARQFATDQSALISALQNMVDEFGRRREQLYVAARRDVVLLAVAIASRIAGRFGEMADIAPNLAAEACGEALQLIRGATDVTVAAHPADAAAVEKLAVELNRSLKAAAAIHLVEDETVDRGGVRLSSADTRVEASIQERIDRIASELIEGWRERLAELNIKP